MTSIRVRPRILASGRSMVYRYIGRRGGRASLGSVRGRPDGTTAGSLDLAASPVGRAARAVRDVDGHDGGTRTGARDACVGQRRTRRSSYSSAAWVLADDRLAQPTR